MIVITPGVVKPPVVDVFRCKCYKCDAVIEYTYKDTHYDKRGSLGSPAYITCPTEGCKEEIIHNVSNNIKYSDEDRSRIFWAKFERDKNKCKCD